MPKGSPSTRSSRQYRRASSSAVPRRTRSPVRGRSAPRGNSATSAPQRSPVRAPADAGTSRRTDESDQPHLAASPAALADTIAISREQLHEMVGGMVQAAVAAAVPAAVPGPSTSQHTSPGASPDLGQPAFAMPPGTSLGGNEQPGNISGSADCVSSDISFHISATNRHNIVSHRFVDLGSLINTSDPRSQASVNTFNLVDGRLQPARSARVIQTFSTWSVAFLRYAGVYLQAHPEDALGLITHMRQVSSLSAPGMGLVWREYDEQFHRAHELFPNVYKWGESDANSPIWLNSLIWITQNKFSVGGMVSVLDDFLFVDGSHDECLSSLTAFRRMSKELHVPLRAGKTVEPYRTLTFLGHRVTHRCSGASLAS